MASNSKIPRAIFVCKDDDTLKVLKAIDEGGCQIALVLDNQKKLVGTITDGDVRRSILNRKTMNIKAENMMNKKFKFAKPCDSEEDIIEILEKYKLHQIPLLNELGEVVEIFTKKIESKKNIVKYPVVIMAGGKGTRLMPFTKDIPKPMVQINGKPILEIVLKKMADAGFRNFYISVNHLREKIMDYFKDGKDIGIDINYLVEDQPLGTAGSLKFLPSSINEPIFVINGDVLTNLNPLHLFNFHSEHKSDITLCAREEKIYLPFGVVETNKTELIEFVEKPTYYKLVNAGIYIINPNVLSLIPSNKYIDMPQLLELAKNKSYKVSVCPMHEYWIDIGRPETLAKASKEWRN